MQADKKAEFDCVLCLLHLKNRRKRNRELKEAAKSQFESVLLGFQPAKPAVLGCLKLAKFSANHP